MTRRERTETRTRSLAAVAASLAGVALLAACVPSRTLRVDLEPQGLRIDGHECGPLILNPSDGYLDFPDSLYSPGDRQGMGYPRVEPLWRLATGKPGASAVELRCDTNLRFMLLKPLLRSLAQAGVATVALGDRQGRNVEVKLLDPSEAKPLFHDSLIQVQILEGAFLVGAGVAPVPQEPGLYESFSLQPAPLAERPMHAGEPRAAAWNWVDSAVAAEHRSRGQARLLEIQPHPMTRIGEVLGLARHLAGGQGTLPLAILGNLPR